MRARMNLNDKIKRWMNKKIGNQYLYFFKGDARGWHLENPVHKPNPPNVKTYVGKSQRVIY